MKNTVKKAAVLISAFLLIFGVFCLEATAAAWSGSGTQASPYLISDESGLRQLAANVKNGTSYSGKYFKLTSDITLNNVWTPIGTSSTSFKGTFDGNGKTVSGLTATGSYSGMFAYIGSGAVIKNVNMTDFSVTGPEYLAGLVAYADAGTGSITISNCCVSGTLTDNKESYPQGYLGGIVGYADAQNGTITISDCTSAGTNTCDYHSGGILGYGRGNNYSLKIINCVNNAYIDADDDANACGGIAGTISNAEVTACINNGNVYGNGFSEDNGSSWLGGICGEGGGNIFRGCANYGNITTFFAGGISPAQTSNNVAVDCINAGTIRHSSDGYGCSYLYSASTVLNCFSPTASEIANGSVAHSLRQYFGQKIGTDARPVILTEDNRVYEVTVVGEVTGSYYVNRGGTIEFPELSDCAAYFDGDAKFNTSSAVYLDYALAAIGYHNFSDGTCMYCGSGEVSYTAAGSCGESVAWYIDKNGTALNIRGSGEMANYSPSNPAPWNEYADKITGVYVYSGVTTIGDCAFTGLTNVSSVNVPETVTKIGSYAFKGLTKLAGNFSLWSGVTEIGDYAFSSCTEITSFTYNKLLETIGNYAFSQCEKLNYVTLPASVVAIGNGAFMNCTNLDYLSLNNKLRYIGAYAFSGTALTDFSLPGSIEQIGANAFADCAELWQVTFLGKPPVIASTAFENVTASVQTPAYDSSWDSAINKNYGGTLSWAIGSGTYGPINWIVDYTKTLRIAGNGAMADFDYSRNAPWYFVNKQIEAITVGNGVTYIGNYAFNGCSNAESVSIADTVKKIGSKQSYTNGYCFIGCDSLTEITVPSGVTEIADAVFSGCSNLKSIKVAYGNSYFSSEDGVLYNSNKTVIYCCPAGKTGTFTIPSGVTEIKPYAFAMCTFTEITIPANIESIGKYAFYQCYDLNKITFEGSAPSDINSSSFSYVTADVYYPTNDASWTSDKIANYGGTLTWHAGQGTCGTGVNWELVYEGSSAYLTVSGSGAMNDYTSSTVPWSAHTNKIKALTVSSGVTSVGAYALYNATALTSVTLADSVKTVGNYAFSGCTSLYRLELGNGLQSIGEHAFYDIKASEIIFPDSLKTIGRYAFYYCDYLKSIKLGNNMQSIGYTAFGGCTALTDVDLGNSITTLEQSAFNGCTKLKKIVIPASVTSVGNYAFRNCTGLQYAEFKGNAPTISSNAFEGTTINAYYSSSASGWTSNKTANYGGTLTWGTISQRGTCNSFVEWILDSKGNLFICGSGSMPSYSATESAPWYNYRSSIKKVTTRGISTIGAYAFKDCPSISQVRIHSGLSYIYNYAFADCTGLEVVIFDGSQPSFSANSFSAVTCEMWYPGSSYNWSSSSRKDYGGELTWRNITSKGECGTNLVWGLDSSGVLFILGSGTMNTYLSTTMPWYSVRSSIKSLIVGESVTSISNYAFYGHTSLTSVSFGKKVASVGNYAFSGCSALNTITFSGAAPAFSAYSFRNVTATAAYPIAESSWTSAKRQNYGGTITWTAVCNNHKEVILSAVSPTCTATGLTEGKRCSLCKEILIAQEVIPALGHYAIGPDGTEVPAATLEPDCFGDIMCTVCKNVAIASPGHRVLGAVLVETDPIAISYPSSYSFTLTEGTYYSTNHSNSTSSEIRFTAKYDCSITLTYGVSSEKNYDELYINLNKTLKDSLSGEVSNRTMSFTLKAGDYVSIRYKKDSSDSSGSDRAWVKAEWENVMAPGIGDVSANTAEPDCTNAVVCRYCQTVVKEALGHRVILVQPEPENPYEVINTSAVPFVLTDGVYYSNNHTSGSSSELKIKANIDCTLELNYGVSSEPTYDYLTISRNNETLKTISGLVSDQTLTLNLAASDVICIRYHKDGSVNKNEDKGWVSVLFKYEPTEEIVPAETIEEVCNGVACDFCDAIVKEAAGHNMGEWSIVTDSTCSAEGSKHRICTRCDYSETQKIDKISHKYNSAITTPTCTEKGYTTYTCVCGDTYTEDIAALGHDKVSHDAKTATCTEIGWESYVTCQNCDYSTYIEIPVDDTNHLNTKDTEAITPTCSAVGYTSGVYCNDCQKYVSGHEEIKINAENHKWDGGEITTFATCKVNGVKTYICEHNSNHTYTETLGLNVNNHVNPKNVTKVSATCSTVGYTAGVYCNDCLQYVSGHREITMDSSAHKWDNGVITTPATCKAGGVKTYTCQHNPQHTYNEKTAVNASNHINTVNVMSEEATCSEIGYTAGIYCNDCRKYVSGHEEIKINAENHKWDGGEITTFATCKVNGVKTYTCEHNSEHTRTENLGLDINNHVNVKNVAEVEATCSTVGYTAGVFCNDCQKYISGHKEIAINTSAHKWDAGKVTTTATCKLNGVKTYTCEHNSKHTYTENLGFNASNHVNTKNVAEVNATCSTVGYTAGVYCNDCRKYVSGHEEIKINAENHKWDGGEITTFATCKVNGVKTYTCENNSEHTYTENLGLNVNNHVNTKNVAGVSATCSTVGYTAGVYCNDCQKYISGHKEIATDSSAHKWDAGKITTTATCKINGVKTYTCEHNSTHTYTETLGLNASNHVNTKNVAEVEATCSSVGYSAGVYCNDCRKYVSGHEEIRINAENHKWDGGEITTFATCKVNGVKTYICEHNSEHTRTETHGLNANNHVDIKNVEAKAPTCSSVGYTAGIYCNDCQKYISGHQGIATDASAHKWDAGKITTTATCKLNGVKTYTCLNNSAHTRTEHLGLNASNHVNTKNVAEVNATCSAVGYTAGVYCNDCQKYISGHQEIAINTSAHKWDTGKVTATATCKEKGIKIYTCQNNSNHTYTETLGLNASNHVNTKNVAEVNATCSTVGYTAGIYCNDCQKHISGHNEVEKNPSAHVNTKNVAEVPATTEKAGYTAGVYCNDCQKYISGHTEIPKLEVTFTDSENAKEAGEYILVNSGFAAEELLAQAGKGALITDSKGNVLASDKLPGTGMTLTLSSGKKYTVIVLGDVDCDGTVTAADARLALRASVGLEQYEENSYQYIAANVESNDNLSATDARLILRAAVGLEKLYVLKKD